MLHLLHLHPHHHLLLTRLLQFHSRFEFLHRHPVLRGCLGHAFVVHPLELLHRHAVLRRGHLKHPLHSQFRGRLHLFDGHPSHRSLRLENFALQRRRLSFDLLQRHTPWRKWRRRGRAGGASVVRCIPRGFCLGPFHPRRHLARLLRAHLRELALARLEAFLRLQLLQLIHLLQHRELLHRHARHRRLSFELFVGAPLELLHGHPRRLRPAFHQFAFPRLRLLEELLHGDTLLLRVGANASVQSRLGLRLDLKKRLSVLTPRSANRGRRTVPVPVPVAVAIGAGVRARRGARRCRRRRRRRWLLFQGAHLDVSRARCTVIAVARLSSVRVAVALAAVRVLVIRAGILPRGSVPRAEELDPLRRALRLSV